MPQFMVTFIMGLISVINISSIYKVTRTPSLMGKYCRL